MTANGVTSYSTSPPSVSRRVPMAQISATGLLSLFLIADNSARSPRSAARLRVVKFCRWCSAIAGGAGMVLTKAIGRVCKAGARGNGRTPSPPGPQRNGLRAEEVNTFLLHFVEQLLVGDGEIV